MLVRKNRILAVDDEDTILDVYRGTFELDYELRCASRVDEAMETAQEFCPDLILLDINMIGDGDGYGLCEQLRTVPCLRDTKIVLVSGRASINERLAGYEVGADDYVVKPFDVEEFEGKGSGVLAPELL